MKPAFTIIRVSGQDQLNHYGPSTQWTEDVIPAAPLLGLEVSEKYRRVIQEPATGWDRPIFESCIREALFLYHRGEIQALLFPRQDRESRFIYGSFPLLVEVVRSGMPVYFAREKFALDPNDPDSTERYLNKAVQSQAYVETMRTNTIRGKKARAQSGKLPCGLYCLYGYTYSKDTGKCTINEQEAVIVRKIFNYAAKDRLSIREIVRRLNNDGVPTPKGNVLWARSTIARILKNPEYAGKCYTYKTASIRKGKRNPLDARQWIELPDAIPPIISQEIYQQAQKQINENHYAGPITRKHDYLLKGLIYCGICGNRYHGIPLHDKRYYRCSSHSMVGIEYCRNKIYKADDLEADVWNYLSENIHKPEQMINEIEKRIEPETRMLKIQAEKDIKEERVKKLKEGIERLVKLCASIDNVDIQEVSSQIKKHREEIVLLEGEMNSLNDQLATSEQMKINKDRIIKYCQELEPKVANATYETKRDLLKYFNVVAKLCKDKIEAKLSPPRL